MGNEARIAEEAEASEVSRDEPAPSDAVGTRPGRTRAAVLSVRLNPAELEDLTERARVSGVPVSTLARSLIVRGLQSTGTVDINQGLREVVVLTVHETVHEVLEQMGPRATTG